jgi:sugar O-acyltransferase (sialic acid O-acetyltransferase NeuD family)
MPSARSQLARHGTTSDRLVFIDDDPAQTTINGHKVVTRAQFLALPASIRRAAITIASSTIRERLSVAMSDERIQPWSVIAESVIIMDDVEIGEGAVLSPFVTLASNTRIGKHFHANLYSYIEHDCIVGDFVTLAPGARVNGNIVVEDHAYIGSGAVIKQGRPGSPIIIGRGAVVGMGAVVTRSVPAGVTVVGNPARPHTRQTVGPN